MKLIILLTITLTVNVSLLIKGSQLDMTSQGYSNPVIVKNMGFTLLNTTIKHINATMNNFLNNLNDFNHYVSVNFLGNSQMNKISPVSIKYKKLTIQGDSDYENKNKRISCFL